MHQATASSPPPPITAAFRLKAEPESAATARRLARQWLTTLDPTAELPTGDAELLLTELVANGVQHTASAHLLCRLSTTGDTLRVEVEDEGGTLAVPRPQAPADAAERGRGLMLVAALAAEWGVTPVEPEGRTVWAVLKLGDGDD
jgi:anti-sigma regulatory factor (Ser/Thr protein kinase)